MGPLVTYRWEETCLLCCALQLGNLEDLGPSGAGRRCLELCWTVESAPCVGIL